ncbi:MAG TPA: AfsR/SARP family transcriptional regulator [Streptosporangiaceae bacterium]|nr:AfsR/SARP family transcriptional regulator [Streptosporangiaceae bacterium]
MDAPTFGILGPLAAQGNGHSVVVRAAKQRALLAVMLIRAGQEVSTDRLIEELWEGAAPATARNTLHSLILRLRRTLSVVSDDGKRLLQGRVAGYALQVVAAQVDSGMFEVLVARSRDAEAAGKFERASALLSEALMLWRGPAFASVPPTPMIRAEAIRLDELRLASLESRIEIDLRLGRHAGLVGELRTLVEQHPLRERLWKHLMQALYVTGRQVDAVAAYRRVRAMFVREFGLEPGPELQRVHQKILTGRYVLEPPR